MIMQWQAALLPAASTIQDAILCLDRSGMQIVLVVADDHRFIGTITDGDIRRGLLRELTLASPISEIVNREPLILPPGIDRQSALNLMRANKIHQLPIVDHERRVTGMYVWDDLSGPTERPHTMVIMAGGKGTRLRPYTENCPKPLLPIAGKPMLEHIIERACNDGIQNFLISVGYLGHMIKEYFGDGRAWNVEIGYLTESEPLGTGGALSLMDPVPQMPILVTNGDVLAEVRYGEILDYHERHDAAATMAVRTHEWQHPFGVVSTQGVEITGFEEKPVYRSHVNAGIYVIEASSLSTLRRGEYCDMPTLFERLKAVNRRTIVYPMHEPWLDVGRPDDLKRAEMARSA